VPRSARDVNWSLLAATDVQAIHDTLARHHPGLLDAWNPAFAAWHQAGLTTALDAARSVTSPAGYVFALRAYVAGFRDNHLNIGTRIRLPLKWPGFTVRWRDRRFLVCRPPNDADGYPPEGAELVECDGRPPAEVMAETIFPYGGTPDLEASWIEWAPWLLIDRGNPWTRRPNTCAFAISGQRQRLALEWRRADPRDIATVVERAQFGPAPEFGVRTFAPDCVWISLPSFRPRDASDRAMLQGVVRLAPNLRASRLLVFDVRGNRGGNSQWGEDILNALYGPNYVQWRAHATGLDDAYVEWRVSAENVRYLRWLLRQLRREWPPDSPAVRRVQAVIAAMRACQKAGLALCPYREPAEDIPYSDHLLANPVTARVVLLTDGRCGSACLDFADLLFAMGDVVHAGTATEADSVYGDVRTILLPSRRARLTFAMKVHRSRPRGHNMPYVPQLRWTGEISDTPAIERWLVSQLAV